MISYLSDMCVAFTSLLSVSSSVALDYVDKTNIAPRTSGDKDDRIVTLLSPSGADLFVTLFALLRLGYGVLLLAYVVSLYAGMQLQLNQLPSPQNTTEAIAHLCGTTCATYLVYHPTLADTADAAAHVLPSLKIVEIASRNIWQFDLAMDGLLKSVLTPADESDLTALIMHTSGSTGMPKVCRQDVTD